MDTINIGQKRGIYNGEHIRIVVRAEGPNVVMFINDSRTEYKTPVAHKAGFDLVKKSDCLPGEFITMRINGRELDILPQQAKQIGGALLRKADFADDYQLMRKAK